MHSMRPTSSSAVVGQSQAITAWASVGAGFIALQLFVFARWVSSPLFTPAPTGDSPLPLYTQYVIWLFQATFPLFILGAIAWFVWKTRRDGRAPAYGMIMFGWATAYWQDPLINYVRPSFSYNSHWLNFGSWCELVPGWLSPHGSRMPEPLLFGAGAYAFWIPVSTLICLFFMRLAKRILPSIGTLGLLGVALVTMFITDLIVEGLLVLTGLYSYLGVIHAWSLFSGELHQFPLYESLLGGAAAAASGALFYFRDDKGNMLVERGVDNLKLKRGQGLLRAFAVSGFINTVLVAYTVLFIFVNLQLDAFPSATPSYFLNGVCGRGTEYECPGKDVHIPLRTSGPLLPFTGRN